MYYRVECIIGFIVLLVTTFALDGVSDPVGLPATGHFVSSCPALGALKCVVLYRTKENNCQHVE